MQNIDGTQEEPLIVLTAGYGEFTSDFKAAVFLFGNILEASSKTEKRVFPTQSAQLALAGRTNCFSHSCADLGFSLASLQL